MVLACAAGADPKGVRLFIANFLTIAVPLVRVALCGSRGRKDVFGAIAGQLCINGVLRRVGESRSGIKGGIGQQVFEQKPVVLHTHRTKLLEAGQVWHQARDYVVCQCKHSQAVQIFDLLR